MAIIKIPAVMRESSDEPKEVTVRGETVLEAIKSYTEEYESKLEEEVIENDEIKQYINVYVNGKDVRDREGVDTPVEDDDEIRIIPAASGGCGQ